MLTMERNDHVSGESRPDIEKTLQEYDPYIVTLVRSRFGQSTGQACVLARDVEVDDIVQAVRIKLWRVLQEREIVYLKPYIRRIVQNEFVDLIRRHKQTLPLPEDVDGEISQGNVIFMAGESTADPALIVEQQQAVEERMEKVVDALLNLPSRQQHVMLCSLRDRMDDPSHLTHVLQRRARTIREWQWPSTRQEKQLLLASLSYARRGMAVCKDAYCG